jgi:superoxide dismutase, Cu-Zn family
MTRIISVIALSFLVGTAALSAQMKHVDLKDAKGNSVGMAMVSPVKGGGVSIDLDVHGLPPGEHAIHFHAVPKCEAPFTSAGGHFNPTQRSHGYKSPMANHAGDLPNFLAVASGDGHVEAISRDLSLAPGPVGLFDGDGASLVVHAGADDYQSDPAGNSGNRIACGVITR